MKKFLCVLISLIVVTVAAVSGCSVFGGADGKDGQDLNIYDVYEATNAEREKEGLQQLSFLEFISEYLHYDFAYGEAENLQTVINRSLLSSVGIIATFGSGMSAKSYAASGVIVDLDKDAGNAYILTNAHVVYKSDLSPQTARSVGVCLYGNDDLEYRETLITDVQIVNYALTYDLALLKVTGSAILMESDARAAVFAESDDVYAGESVFTVGNPEGMGISVTTGIISKESEYIALDFASMSGEASYYRVMRTDAGVNGGNSGGALYDSSGRIVGIINSKEPDADVENMGYALCGSYVKRLYKLMRDGYKSASGQYGIRRAVFKENIYGYTTKARFNNDTGLTEITDTVYITERYGGLAEGDIVKRIKITDTSGAAVEDVAVTRFYNIEDVLISAREGYRIIFTVDRSGGSANVTFIPSFENFA